MPLIDANGVRLHVQQLGDQGPPVLLLHGILFDSLATWYFTVAPRLARRRRVYLVDWRGHGRSEQVTSGFGLRSLAADVAAVADELDLESAAVVGFSYGGAVALRYAADHPGAVDRLAVVDAPVPVLRARGLEWLERPLPEQPLEAWLDAMPERQRDLLRADGRRARRLVGRIERLYSATSLRDDVAAEPDIDDADLARIACPVLLAYGSRSWYGTTRDRLAAVLPDARVRSLDGGHFLPLEAPDALAASLDEFLDA